MRGVHERTASRRPRSSYEDQAHRENYEETENRRNRLVTYYDDEESSINSSRRERQRYNVAPHQPEYNEEIQQNSPPITYDGRESERDALANYQPTDYDETQQNSARSQSQGRIRERPTHNQEEVPKQTQNRHVRVRTRTNFNEDEPEKEERRHSKEYYYKNALEITDEETSHRKSDRQQRQSHSRSSSRYIYGQHEVPKRVKSKEPKKHNINSEQFDNEGVQYYSEKRESQGHGKTRQKENTKIYKGKEAQREEAGSNASKDSVTGSDQSEEEMNSPNDLNESDLETVQQSSDESDGGSTSSSSIESDFETWLKKPVKQKHKLNVKAEKDKQALSLEDNESRNRDDVIDEDIRGRSSEDKQRHRFEGRPPPSPSRADNSQRAKRREQESANAAEEKHKAAKHWHDVSYPPSPRDAEGEEADQSRIPRFYSSEDIAAHPVIPLVECEHAIGQINVFVRLLYSFRMRTSRVLYKRNGKSNSKLLVFNMGEMVVNGIEWARIERPLDDTQLAFAVQNSMHLKRREDGATTLDLEAFMMNPFFVRMIQDEKIRQILCRILFDERDDSTNNESKAEGRSTIQKINSSQKISDPHRSRAPKNADKMKRHGQNESGESSKSGRKSGNELSNSSLLKRRQSLAKNSENDPLQRDLAVRIIEPTSEWGGKENQYHDRNSSESSPISTMQEHLSLRSPNIGQRSPSIRSPMQALKISAQGEIVENDSTTANELNVSSSDHSKYDCQIAEQLLKHWLALKEPNRNKRIQMYLSQTFMDRNPIGRNLLKKMGTKNYKKISETIEKLERIVTEKPKNERLFLRKMSEQFDKFMTLMEQIMNEKSCNYLSEPPIEEISPKNPRGERIEMYWDDEIMETKSQEKVDGEVSNEKPFQKISKQLINQLRKLRGRFDAKPKKGRGFIALLEDIYFEIGSPGLRSKINKISEAMKWSGLREVSISLRQRKSAMINAWRRVAWLCRELVIMADLVERAEEAFAALDRLLEALKLLAVGTNLKQEFERLDGGGDTELNQEGGGGGQAGQLANEEPFDFAAFVNVLDIFGMKPIVLSTCKCFCETVDGRRGENTLPGDEKSRGGQ
ncbi:hypothetical protein niasHT_017429 [Heterodera trifolii]|uniref:Uncharacterized protein n=1 Tax=Heterodera trifolii TaxID=157864 RepID=A0ABD2LJ58_9BILA